MKDEFAGADAGMDTSAGAPGLSLDPATAASLKRGDA